MALRIDKRPDEAILVIETHPPLDANVDAPQATEATLAFQSEINGAICRITDYTRTPINFGDLVAGMAADKAFQHPDVLSVVVGSDEMVKLVANSFKQKQYGEVDVKITATLEEALSLAHQLLKEHKRK